MSVVALVAVVAAGAVVGALLRWAIGEAWPQPGPWPWPLWCLNVLGAGLLGLATGSVTVRERPLLAAALGPGLLGGFTSVSAAAEDVRTMLAEGSWVLAGSWWGSMLLASVIAVGVGRWLGAARGTSSAVDR